jgi:acetyl-CoA acetyltransferase
MSGGPQIAIIGAGIAPFGRHDGVSGIDMGVAAVRAAVADAGLTWPDMEFAYGGSVDGGNADTMVSHLGPTGLPVTNVHNGCATGGSSLAAAARALEAGAFDVGVVVGFDKHPRGAFAPRPEDWSLPAWYGEAGLMVTTQFFGAKLQRYMHDHGVPERTLAQVAEKAFHNASLTPTAWRRTPLSIEQIEASPMLADPLRQFMFCSPGEGAVALVVCTPRYLAKRKEARPIWVRSVAFRTRLAGSFDVFSPALSVDLAPSPTVATAQEAFASAGLRPEDVDVVQVQDTESGAELIHLAECGFCEDGEQAELYAGGQTRIDGRLPVNTDGGCIGNGEPVGASGLRQVHEVVLQLRGEAGARQVPGSPAVGFTHVYGAPGVSACAVLSR